MALSQNPYARLVRLGNPIGTWLLMWPGIWSAILASRAMNLAWPAHTMMVIAIGALLMRSAGCIVNDLTDQDLDGHVDRTKNRPLVTGEISRRTAWLLALLLVGISALLILPYGWPATLTAMAALPLIVLYPRMKRMTWWPQAFLGLTFNWGALLGWVMVTGSLDWPALALYAAGIFWTLGYDTIYAHQDREDDALVGIRSTARLFGEWSDRAIALCFLLALLCWGIALTAVPFDMRSAVAFLALIAYFCWQLLALDIHQPALCGALFRSHSLVGWLLLLALL